MAYTQADLDALEAAIGSGERQVTYDGKTVEFRSVAELRAAHAEVSKALLGSSKTPLRRLRHHTRKGL